MRSSHLKSGHGAMYYNETSRYESLFTQDYSKREDASEAAVSGCTPTGSSCFSFSRSSSDMFMIIMDEC